MDRPSKQTEVQVTDREELVRAILDVLTRTYTGAEKPGGFQWVAEFFRRLDEPTLRAIAYQQGAFEPDLEIDPEERDSGRPGPS